MRTKKYQVGQIIRYCDQEWKAPEGLGFSNEVDDFTGVIEKVQEKRIFVKVLSVNTKDSKGRWRPTTMRQIGRVIELQFETDAPYITVSEISDILYG